MQSHLLTVSVALCCVVLSGAYREYADRIPNGIRVPHPCKPNVYWKGVGHLNVAGGGQGNVFGVDFYGAGFKWTTELCQKDSDGDGKSNGVELGDPDCIWQPGKIPAFTSNLSHPGICDPYDSMACRLKAIPAPAQGSSLYPNQDEWMTESCKDETWTCPPIEEEGVYSTDFRIPFQNVPAKETTYMCMLFDWLDVTTDYHVIAMEPIINNSFIMHHMLLFGCKDDKENDPNPKECNMGGCNDILAGWTVGIQGDCFNENAGVLFGKSGYKKFMIQYHWNNPNKHDFYTDSSGMKLHYTTKLRPNNMGMFMVGQVYLSIPPGSKDYLASSVCDAEGTNNLMNGSVSIVKANNHMHYLGFKMSMEQRRDGVLVNQITDDEYYSYDTPVVYDYDKNPLVLSPGDSIHTYCHFRAKDKRLTTFYGDGTNDEMCFGFLTYYPKENINKADCLSWKDIAFEEPSTFKDCDYNNFYNETFLQELPEWQRVTSMCTKELECLVECKLAIKEATESHPCFARPVMFEFTRKMMDYAQAGKQFNRAYMSCRAELMMEAQTGNEPNGPNANDDDTNGASSQIALPLSMILIHCLFFLYSSLAL